ncbi:Hypothetical predicted protein [Pelobates cultripes]|uniref:Uncharacterized protein n=1 Tax=Pelobates cultripes TaxID=61616 RepID=A0AAD1SH74_PELCU|nr:Hypothetical predicted protein [Pelobates cultripes]
MGRRPNTTESRTTQSQPAAQIPGGSSHRPTTLPKSNGGSLDMRHGLHIRPGLRRVVDTGRVRPGTQHPLRGNNADRPNSHSPAAPIELRTPPTTEAEKRQTHAATPDRAEVWESSSSPWKGEHALTRHDQVAIPSGLPYAYATLYAKNPCFPTLGIG